MIIRSDHKKTRGYSIGVLLVGALFIRLTHGKAVDFSNEGSAYLLGLLLLFIGVAGLLASTEEQEITLDAEAKKITIKKDGLLNPAIEYLRFEQVSRLVMTSLAARGSIFGVRPRNYFLFLELKDGRKISLKKHSWDRDEMTDLAQNICEILSCPFDGNRFLPQNLLGLGENATAVRLTISLVSAIGLWAIYYRIAVGPWCPAMWFGTAPIFVMLVTFATTYNITKRWL